MALYSLYCAEVPWRNCSLTHSCINIKIQRRWILGSKALTRVIGLTSGNFRIGKRVTCYIPLHSDISRRCGKACHRWYIRDGRCSVSSIWNGVRTLQLLRRYRPCFAIRLCSSLVSDWAFLHSSFITVWASRWLLLSSPETTDRGLHFCRWQYIRISVILIRSCLKNSIESTKQQSATPTCVQHPVDENK